MKSHLALSSAVLAILIGLGSCTHLLPGSAPAPVRHTQAPKPKKVVAKKPETAQQPASVAAPASTAPAAAAPLAAPAVAPTEAPAEAAPVEIVGKAETEVRALLGTPVAVTAAPPGKVLQFVGEGCAVDVHFFPDLKKGGFRALEVAAADGRTSPTSCVGRIRGARG